MSSDCHRESRPRSSQVLSSAPEYPLGVVMRTYPDVPRRWTGPALGLMAAIAFLLVLSCGGSSDAPAATSRPSDTPGPVATPTTAASPTSTAPPADTPSPDPTATTVVTPNPTTTAAPTRTPEPTGTTTSIPTPSPVPPTATSAPAPSNVAREQGEVQGVTFTVGEGSEATFIVREQLTRLPLPSDAVVLTTASLGELHLDGRPSVFEIDLHQLSSDQARRDGYIRQRMFPSDPTAVFTVEDLGPLPPGFTDGDTVSATVAGRLAIRGTEFPISFEVEARDDGDVIFILGRTTFVWADLDIRPPNIGRIVQVEDEVKVQILLAARPL